jgi:hypothetical protein
VKICQSNRLKRRLQRKLTLRNIYLTELEGVGEILRLFCLALFPVPQYLHARPMISSLSGGLICA